MQLPTQQCVGTTKILLYGESINMLDGLPNDEVIRSLEEHPKIVTLFEVDIVEGVTPYVTHREDELDEPHQEAIR